MLLTKKKKIKNAVQLWQECFNDSVEWIEDYFSIFNAKNNLHCIYKNENLVSMLMAAEYNWRYNNNILPFIYLSGVCTKKQLRNQGLSSSLIKNVLLKSYTNGKMFCGLIVANKDLKEFYKKFGFVSLNFNEEKTIFKKQKYSPNEIHQMFENGIFSKIDNSVIHNSKTLSLYSEKHYETVDCSSNRRMQMFRIINAEEVLKLYAKKFPEKELVFELKDQVFRKNNQVFSIQRSRVFSQKSNENTNIKKISIEELTSIIFQDAYMFLMNER